MQSVLLLRKLKHFSPVFRLEYHKGVQKRHLATVKDVFPHKTDFPSRHIGPRKTEVVEMLDLLGYKVCISIHHWSINSISLTTLCGSIFVIVAGRFDR